MKFREFITSSGKRVLAGKNAEQNEELVKQFIGKDNIIFHYNVNKNILQIRSKLQ